MDVYQVIRISGTVGAIYLAYKGVRNLNSNESYAVFQFLIALAVLVVVFIV